MSEDPDHNESLKQIITENSYILEPEGYGAVSLRTEQTALRLPHVPIVQCFPHCMSVSFKQ